MEATESYMAENAAKGFAVAMVSGVDDPTQLGVRMNCLHQKSY